ncbi:MAG: type II secretion system protein [Pedosphaera sp.]|nr:type II secretion system protein [Pedosphaera sp.]
MASVVLEVVHRMKGRQQNGFSFWELMIVLSILAVVSAAILPGMMRARRRSARINCTNNQKQVSLAFKQWALDQSDSFPMARSQTNGGTMELVASGLVWPHYLVMSNELNTPKVLVCPTDTNRLAATNWDSLRNLNLSYFVGVDALDTQPSMFLIGDRNISIAGEKPRRGLISIWTNTPIAWTEQIHGKQGNIGLADGSVQGLSNKRLQETFAATGFTTNRLAFP